MVQIKEGNGGDLREQRLEDGRIGRDDGLEQAEGGGLGGIAW